MKQMNMWLVLIPFAGAFTGWLVNRMVITLLFYPLHPVHIAGFTFHGLLFKRQQQWAGKIGKLAGKELFSFKDVEHKILSEENLLKIMPDIEAHIDHFLRIKLKEAMPVIAMFVGDKTIHQLKEIFMAELQTLFPLVMKNYLSVLEKDVDLEYLVAHQLKQLSPEKIQSAIRPVVSGELRLLTLTGAVTGLITGIVSLLFILFFLP